VKVLAGPASPRLGREVAKELGSDILDYKHSRFPDTSFYARLEFPDKAKDEICVVVQSCIEDRNIVEMLVLQDMLHEAKCAEVVVVAPYFGGYSRQDKVFEAGEPVSARSIARHFELEASCFLTVDIHNPVVLESFTVPAINVSSAKAFAPLLRKRMVDLVVAPDRGAYERAERAAKALDVECDHLEKRRLDAYTVEITPSKAEVQGKRVAVVDDVISTGGTVIKAREMLMKQGAVDVTAVCTHGLFALFNRDRIPLLEALDVACTDAIENEFSRVSVGGVIAEAIREKRS
jgi:ribose-phosphate pyrophosphokinase